jgi:homoaconitase/3-isopropylmalate dehydratase large subunit
MEQIQRVIDYPGEMVLDSYNYEAGKFCALAIGVGLDKTMIAPTHEKVFETLTGMGYNVYNTRGIPGEFYTNNRLEDLLEAAREVLQEKTKENANK